MTLWGEFMDAAGYVLWGIGFGFALSAPVGPVNIIVLQRALFGRVRDGFLIGLGAAVGDAFYAALAAFGLGWVHATMAAHSTTLKIVGGLVMTGFAIKIWQAKPHLERTELKGRVKRNMTATLALTLSNPGVFLGLVFLFSAAGIGDLGSSGRRPIVDAFALMVGVFVGASLWWATLAGLGAVLRDKMTDALLIKVNRLSAVSIGLFALVAFVTGLLDVFTPADP